MKKRLQHVLACLLLCALLTPCLAAPAAAAGFTDVPPNHWTAPSIRRCAELGFFQGETTDTFGLGHEMTRAAFVVVLSRFFGWEIPAVEKSAYEDVPAGAWYAGAVKAAYANGALTAQTGAFRPDDPITREEMAVMLARALGYNGLAGLAQELPALFQDVTTNPGYIALSQELGLVTGASATSFAPDRAATREEVAVTLVRLYDKLHAGAPGKVGIALSAQDLPDVTGFEAVAVYGGQLIFQNGGAKLTSGLNAEEAALVRTAAREAGAKQLLYLTGASSFLRSDAKETAAMIAAAVTAGSYDGLFLDVKELPGQQKRNMTSLVTALRGVLGAKLLYVAAEAPSWHGANYQGYDYKALAAQADRLVLRVAPYDETISGVPTAPMEPLEEVYYAMAQMNNKADMAKVSLMLTTTASVWADDRQTGTLSGTAVAAYGTENAMTGHYADRYACAYLYGAEEDKQAAVWYLDGQAVAERVRLLSCFDVNQVCLSQLSGAAPELLEALK